jgi:hypothetical protein
MFIFIGVPSFWRNNPPIQAIGATILGTALILYILYNFWRSFWMQRFIITIEDKNIYLKDILLRKLILLDNSFKGYSYSSYGDSRAVYDFKTLLFYFNDGRIIEFPQFLFTNFKKIHEALLQAKVNFLGNEPYRWKNLISRVYLFR